MKVLERFIYIGIIIFIGWIAITGKTEYVVSEIPGDTIVQVVNIPYDSLIYVTDSFYDVDTLWLPQDTAFLPSDTVKVYADYFEMHTYDSIMLRNDSSITMWVSAKVTQNRLYEIKGYSLNNRKTKIVSEESNQIGIGIIMGAYTTAPMVSYQFNNNNVGLGYNLMNNEVLLSYKRIIKIKK